jgi:hypothetical protein
MGKAKSVIEPKRPVPVSKHGGGYIKTGKYVGAHKAKMDKKAAEMGMRYENGKFYPLEKPEAIPIKPKVKAPAAPPEPTMRVMTDEDTFKNEFFEALGRTFVPAAAEPEPPVKVEKEKAWYDFGEDNDDEEPEPKKKESENPHSREEPAEEEPPPGFGFEFEWDDEDVDKALDMIPLITIPISSIIAWFFGRTLQPEMISMPEWKRNLLRPGVKHYGAKIMQAISTPEFFWTALVGLILFDALFNSTKDPEGPKHTDYHEEEEEEDITDHREVA